MAVLTKHPHLFNKHHCTFLVNLNRNQQSSHAKINSSRLDQPAVISTLLYNTNSSYFSFCTTGVVRFSFKNWINEVVETTPIYIHSINSIDFFFQCARSSAPNFYISIDPGEILVSKRFVRPSEMETFMNNWWDGWRRRMNSWHNPYQYALFSN